MIRQTINLPQNQIKNKKTVEYNSSKAIQIKNKKNKICTGIKITSEHCISDLENKKKYIQQVRR